MEALEFIRQFPIKSYQKGEMLFGEGAASDTLLAVRSGYIKVTSLSDAGLERLLWIAGRYDMAPTEQLFTVAGTLQFFYTALSDCEVYRVHKGKFLAYAQLHPALMSEIALSMSSHYDDLLNRIDSIEQTSIRNKLIHTLCYLARRFSGGDSVDLCQLGLKLTHQDIADMIGSTRETTSLELGKLSRSGGLVYDRSQFTICVSRLMALQVSEAR